MKRLDLTGKVFARLTVLGEAEPRGPIRHWRVICECGTEKVVAQASLRGGCTKSCGCLQREKAAAAHTTHGLSDHPLYAAWGWMRTRCRNPNFIEYDRYGGRGIKVCERWGEFTAFLEDMGPTFRPGLSLDRIDNDGDYEPGNCRWVTQKTQCRNTRRNRTITCMGETKCVAEWAEHLNISPYTLYGRLNRGWCVTRTLITGVSNGV